MAGPKYQHVPQRDSLDGQGSSYAQAPPSYQAEDPTQAALLSGVPRGENDNLPDDFKFGGMVAEATLDIRMAFIRKVYAILYAHTESLKRTRTNALQDGPNLRHGARQRPVHVE